MIPENKIEETYLTKTADFLPSDGASCWAFAATWTKVNSAKLTTENRVYLHPVCACEDNTFEMGKAWRFVGWGNAPWASALGPHAIVYEKMTPANTESIYASTHYHFEPGLYWGHGDAKKMKFRKPNVRCGGTGQQMEGEGS